MSFPIFIHTHPRHPMTTIEQLTEQALLQTAAAADLDALDALRVAWLGKSGQITLQLKQLGTGNWCGYSFAWHAALAARARDGRTAAESLRIFSQAFCLRNSFHCNGDQSGKGYSNMTYRPFTL